MAQRWACAPFGDLRGIVSIAGVAPGPDDPRCEPGVPVSVLQIHGDRDDTILYEGGQRGRARYPSARDSAAMWVRLNGCVRDDRPGRGGSLLAGDWRVESWTGPRARVALWTVEGGGHHIPRLRFATGQMLEFVEGK